MSTTPSSMAALEAELAARRERLAATVDQLVVEAHPKTIIRRQTEAAKAKFTELTRTPAGELRVDRLAAAAAAVVAVGGIVIALRRRSR